MSVGMLVVLALVLLPVQWGLGGICRNHATGSMLRCEVDSCQTREGVGFAFVDPDNHRPRNLGIGVEGVMTVFTQYTGPLVIKCLEGHV